MGASLIPLEKARDDTVELIQDVLTLHSFTEDLLGDFGGHLSTDGKRLWGKKKYEKMFMFINEGMRLTARAAMFVGSYADLNKEDLTDHQTIRQLCGTIGGIAKAIGPFVNQVKVGLVDSQIDNEWTTKGIDVLAHLEPAWRKIDIRANILYASNDLQQDSHLVVSTTSTTTTTTTSTATSLSPEELQKLIDELTTIVKPKNNERKQQKPKQKAAAKPVTTSTTEEAPTTTIQTSTTTQVPSEVDFTGFEEVSRKHPKKKKGSHGNLRSCPEKDSVTTTSTIADSEQLVNSSEDHQSTTTEDLLISMQSTTELVESTLSGSIEENPLLSSTETFTEAETLISTTIEPTITPVTSTRSRLSPDAKEFVPETTVLLRPFVELVAKDLCGSTYGSKGGLERLRYLCDLIERNHSGDTGIAHDTDAFRLKLQNVIKEVDELRFISHSIVEKAEALPSVAARNIPPPSY